MCIPGQFVCGQFLPPPKKKKKIFFYISPFSLNNPSPTQNAFEASSGLYKHHPLSNLVCAECLGGVKQWKLISGWRERRPRTVEEIHCPWGGGQISSLTLPACINNGCFWHISTRQCWAGLVMGETCPGGEQPLLRDTIASISVDAQRESRCLQRERGL